MNFRKNVVTRKATPYAFALPRFLDYVSRNTVRTGEHLAPILVNSFPKSGTHLLQQIVAGIPKVRDWGLFIVSQPSRGYKLVPHKKISDTVERIAAREIVCSHLFYSEKVSDALRARGAVNLFVDRDLRAVAVSEAHYLKSRNPFHALHQFYKHLSIDEAITFALLGNEYIRTPYYYPNIKERYARYSGWRHDHRCNAFRYEELLDKNGVGIERLAGILAGAGYKTSRESLSSSINPAGSHTFRAGAEAWNSEFNLSHKTIFENLTDG